jgi:hypothetical protein
MKVSQNVYQKAMIFALMGLDIYRILIGSFFSIFVPQRCDVKNNLVNSNSTTVNFTAEMKSSHTCELKENISDLTSFNWFVLGLNAFTALSIAIAFIWEFKRETWMVNHLDVNPEKPDNNLDDELDMKNDENKLIEKYQSMKQSLLWKNRIYYYLFFAVGITATLNFGFSLALMIHYYDGFKTMTTFFTNALLIFMRVQKSLSVAKTCEKELKAQSVFLSEPVAFNSIDEKYRVQNSIELVNK